MDDDYWHAGHAFMELEQLMGIEPNAAPETRWREQMLPRLRAALGAPSVGAPDGWKPMPVDPTREMKAAGAEATGMGHDLAHHCWAVMAAKVPAAPGASHAQEAPDFWPIAKLTVDDAGEVTAASLYAPGLPAGVHDVYPESTAYEYARGRADERAALAASGAPHARLAMQLALDALTCASGHDECESLERCAVEALRAALVTKVASQGADHGR